MYSHTVTFYSSITTLLQEYVAHWNLERWRFNYLFNVTIIFALRSIWIEEIEFPTLPFGFLPPEVGKKISPW